MRKTLLALAVAGSFAAGAMAADIQVYGLIDTGFSYTHSDADKAGVKDTDQLRMVSSQEFGSRWGIRGTEDLGNGYKLSFVLESGFNSDTGSMSGDLFAREANMALSGPFGTLRAGRMPIFGSVLGADGLFRAIDPLFGNMTQGFGSSYASASSWLRASNALSYKTPTFAGLTAYAMYSLKNDSNKDAEEGKADSDRYASVALRYLNGDLEAIMVADMTLYGNYRSEPNNAHEDDGLTVTVGGNYAFDNGLKVIAFGQYFKDQELGMRAGVVQSGVKAYTQQDNGYGFVDGWGASIGVNYPVGGGVAKASFNYRDMDNQNDVDFTRWTVAAAYDYPLSKRTS
ncbi:MAG: porin, partial [Sutterellaceae bacterium]|nr:porin [Sutterellaceae bacterium]